jgi:hypothetical protein
MINFYLIYFNYKFYIQNTDFPEKKTLKLVKEIFPFYGI